MKKIYICLCLIISLIANSQFTEGFEGGFTFPSNLTRINQGVSSTWYVAMAGANSHGGSYIASIAVAAGEINDMMVMPPITVVEGVNNRFSFWYQGTSTNTRLKLSTTGNTSLADFSTILSPALPTVNNIWHKYTISLNNYVGQTVYIGIHTIAPHGVNIKIDDIASESGPPCDLAELTVETSPVSCVADPSVNVIVSGLPDGNWILNMIGTNSTSITGSGPTHTTVLGAGTNQTIQFFATTEDFCQTLTTAPLYIPAAYNIPLGAAPTTASHVDTNSDGAVNANDKIKYTIVVENTGTCPLENIRINGFEPNPVNPDLYFIDDTRCADLAPIPGLESQIVEMYYTIKAADISAGTVYNATSISVSHPGGESQISVENTTDLTTLGRVELTPMSVTYYPNPVNDHLFFMENADIRKIEIFTLSGQRLSTATNRDSIDLSALQGGIYMAKIDAGGTIRTIKVIKR